MSLGQIIRKKREQLNLTLDEVSSRIGFSKPYLSTIETGKVKNPPSDELLVKLEKMLEFEQGLLQVLELWLNRKNQEEPRKIQWGQPNSVLSGSCKEHRVVSH